VSRIEELFQAVWQRPDDMELRLVLGDALLELGDPRGELIQLQRRPEADHGRRIMRLLQQYGLTWLGSLRGAVVPIAYELGFLASCVAIEADAGGRIEWATVHTVELEVDEVGFLFEPVMRALRCVAGIDEGHLEPLLGAARCPPELEAILEWERLPALYPALELAPAVRAFGLPGLQLTRDGAGRLAALEARADPGLPRLLGELPARCLSSLVIRGAAPEDRVRLESVARAAQARLESIRFV
jgi:uncharacterized protein (TIGR02996 family)